jgi:hypothetical protein
MLFTADLSFWKYAAAIALLHLVIDLAKLIFQKDENRRGWFVADQLMHLAVITGAWAVHENRPFEWSVFADQRVLTLIFAFLCIWRPSSLIIKVIISKWSPRAVPDTIRTEVESLENAGQLIGLLERLLILVFILLNRWEGVGFLLGAKSIFRFGDLTQAKDTKLTEYVLIGTLLSFSMAIGVGLIARSLLF